MSLPLSPFLLVACASGMAAKLAEAHGGARPDAREPAIDDAASALFVHEAGYRAHFNHGTGESSWPFPRPSATMELAVIGREHGALHMKPAIGDIALQWNPNRAAFTNAAIVVAVADELTPQGAFRCRVLDAAIRSARAHVVSFVPDRGDRFLRWSELDSLIHNKRAA